MRLLLVEDEIDIQRFLRTSLEEAGYQVEAAGDGKTAERVAIDGQFDILIVDRKDVPLPLRSAVVRRA